MNINEFAIELAKKYGIEISKTGNHTFEKENGEIINIDSNNISKIFGDIFKKEEILIFNSEIRFNKRAFNKFENVETYYLDDKITKNRDCIYNENISEQPDNKIKQYDDAA